MTQRQCNTKPHLFMFRFGSARIRFQFAFVFSKPFSAMPAAPARGRQDTPSSAEKWLAEGLEDLQQQGSRVNDATNNTAQLGKPDVRNTRKQCARCERGIPRNDGCRMAFPGDPGSNIWYCSYKCREGNV